jgi:murein DD-endopeptidase MepM/ murein hydrolase activator NlpD
VTHAVQKGQTLFRIAQAYGVKVAVLAEANRIKPSAPLKVGQRLFVPGATAVKTGIEAYAPLSATERTTLEQSLREQPVAVAPPSIPQPTPSPAPPAVPTSPPPPRTRVRTDAEFVWPLPGPINSPFGPRSGRLHAGIDIGSPHYQEVVAAADAEVIYANDTKGPLGKAVVLQHGRGMRTVYAHLSVVIAREGDTVRQGQAIGGVGDTGRATGPHLHFEIRRNGEALNPADHLPATIDDLVRDLSRPQK